jgi:F-box protein 25/32
MPFLGQDWRSPGEQWVRTAEGWERLGLWRLKLFENLNENVLRRLLKLANAEYTYYLLHRDFDRVRHAQTYVLVREVTKEQKMRTTVAEALSRLDMSGATRDHRRFNYVCSLVMFLIQNNMSTLSGMAQKIVINILEQIVNQAIQTHSNIRLVVKLLDETQLALVRGHYDHVGSQQLWDSHSVTVSRLQAAINELDVPEREDDGKMKINDLPDEVLRYILVQLADHQDVVSAGQTGLRTFLLSEEDSLWRSLCSFHFTNRQWSSVLRRHEDLESVGWKQLYTRLVKRYGLRDVYAEMLHLCRHCNALFWQLHGHPCPINGVEPVSHSVTPEMFIKLFSA